MSLAQWLPEPNRRPCHEWSNWPNACCVICGLPDLVEYCQNNHPPECKCQNPPCPASSEEIEQAKKLLYGNKIYTTDDYVTNITVNNSTNNSTNVNFSCSYPAFSDTTTEIIEERYDVDSKLKLFTCRCSKHGNWQVQATGLDLFDPSKTVCDQILHCPTCARPPPDQ